MSKPPVFVHSLDEWDAFMEMAQRPHRDIVFTMGRASPWICTRCGREQSGGARAVAAHLADTCTGTDASACMIFPCCVPCGEAPPRHLCSVAYPRVRRAELRVKA